MYLYEVPFVSILWFNWEVPNKSEQASKIIFWCRFDVVCVELGALASVCGLWEIVDW